ncbi:hypothetical protein Cgig2_019676 [Carnegiea gigantea]|uniref:Uncharacterized protein n=1 Tax=Carnegiea gigantea TaxID=171969 RepID=A0A9Q1K1J7_9CARY|nr:hypothetical protein Cgig2_019676 [Carnegiea gigantea]
MGELKEDEELNGGYKRSPKQSYKIDFRNPSCPASLSPLKPLAHLSGQASRSSTALSMPATRTDWIERRLSHQPFARRLRPSIFKHRRLLLGEVGGILARTGSCIYLSSATSTTVYSSMCSPTTSASSSAAIGKSLKKGLAEIQSSTQDEGTQGDGTPLPQLSIQTQMNIWKKVVGLTKKGKICGFGMQGSYASSTSPSTIKQIPIEVLEKEKQSKKKLKKKLH